MSLSELSRVSGLSEAGIRKIEKTERTPRDSSLNLIVTALAARSPLSSEDITWLSQLTGNPEDTFNAINESAQRHRRNASPHLPKAAERTQSLVFRLQSALDSILASGAEVEAIELLESIARWSVASRHAIDEHAEPVKLTPREREAVRAFRVAHPQRTGEIKGAIIEDFSHYEVDEDGRPRKLSPADDHDPDRESRSSQTKDRSRDQSNDQSGDKNAG